MQNLDYSTNRIAQTEETEKKSCPRCNSEAFILGEGTATHYASLRCAECNQFIRWLPHPKNHESYGDENALINKLLTSSLLNPWELKFCQSLKSQRKRSPKQKQKLHDIANRLKLNHL